MKLSVSCSEKCIADTKTGMMLAVRSVKQVAMTSARSKNETNSIRQCMCSCIWQQAGANSQRMHIHSFIHLFSHSFIHIHSFVRSLIHSQRMLDRPSWVHTGAVDCLQPVWSCANLKDAHMQTKTWKAGRGRKTYSYTNFN